SPRLEPDAKCRLPRKIRCWRAFWASPCSEWCSTLFSSMPCLLRSHRYWLVRFISRNSPMGRHSAWPRSLLPLSADSIRFAAPFSVVSSLACSIICRPPTFPRNIAAHFHLSFSSPSSCFGRKVCSGGSRSARYDSFCRPSCCYGCGRRHRSAVLFEAIRYFPDFNLGRAYHRGYRAEFDARLCRANFAGAGRVCRNGCLYGCVAHAIRRAIFRRFFCSRAPVLCNRLGSWVPRAAGAAPLSGLRDTSFHHSCFPRVAQRGMADQRHLRNYRYAAPDAVWIESQQCARFLFPVPRCSCAAFTRDLVDASLTLGSSLRRLARKSDSRAVPRPRYAALHTDGVCHRLESRRVVRRALRAAGAIYRAEFICPRPVAQPIAHGDCRWQR